MKGLSASIIKVFRENRRLLPAAVIIALLMSALVARYIFNYHETAQRSIALNAERYLTFRAGLMRKEELVTSVDSAETRIKELESGLLKANKPAIAVAEIQEAIKKIAARRGLTITSQKALKRTNRGPYITVPVELQIKMSMPQLRKVLYDIMKADVIMNAAYLRARAENEKGSGLINVTLVVEGLMINTDGESGEGPRS